MLRWLGRLLLVGIILAAIGFVVSRLLGRDDDFDDFDDIDDGFDFQETPVEIDVPLQDNSMSRGTQTAPISAADTGQTGPTQGVGNGTAQATGDGGGPTGATASSKDSGQAAESGGAKGSKLTDINGIGPAYEARLHAMGIESFDDLIKSDPADLSEQLGVIGGQAAVEDWVSQARALASGSSQHDGSSS